MNLKLKTLHELLTLSLWLDGRDYEDLKEEVDSEISLRLRGDTYNLTVEENDNTTIGIARPMAQG